MLHKTSAVLTFSVASHNVEGFEFARQRRIHLLSQSQVGEGCCGNQRYLGEDTQTEDKQNIHTEPSTKNIHVFLKKSVIVISMI